MIYKDKWPYRLNEICECGRMFAVHGSNPPHTNGGNEEGEKPCDGFRAASQPKKVAVKSKSKGDNK